MEVLHVNEHCRLSLRCRHPMSADVSRSADFKCICELQAREEDLLVAAANSNHAGVKDDPSVARKHFGDFGKQPRFFFLFVRL